MRLPWVARRCVRLAAIVALGTLALLLLLLIVKRPADRADDAPIRDDRSHTLTPLQIQQAIGEAELENGERLLLVQNVCRRHNLGVYRTSVARPPAFKMPPTPNYPVFYFDRVHKLSWCPVYKAGSSSWLYNLCLMAANSTYTETQLDESRRAHQLSELARRVYPELDYPDAEQALQDSVKLLVVRHPFERLLSAYRDKLENVLVRTEHGSVHFYRAYGARIVARYRPGGNATHTRHLLRPGTFYWPPNQPQPAGVEPTFAEFVRYLIDVDLLSYADDHWIPVYLYCTPCLVRYDIIAKVETMDRDQLYALNVVGGTSGAGVGVGPAWQHRTAGPRGVGLARRYFGQLTKAQVTRLHNKYLLDFQLFGYDPQPYLDYARDDDD